MATTFGMRRPAEWQMYVLKYGNFSVVGLHCIAAIVYAHLSTVIKLCELHIYTWAILCSATYR